MMGTLLLRLAAPMQSCGADSKFETRRTGDIPSKSGVIGMLSAALGRRRDEPVDDLCALKFGVRVDQPGVLLRDYQTAKNDKSAYVTYRYYLSDAIFLAGLESADYDLLLRLDSALKNPVFPLFLGRRSCPITLPLTLGVHETGLAASLEAEPWLAPEWRRKRLDPELRVVCDAEENMPETGITHDMPISFNPLYRKFGFRLFVESKRAYKGVRTGIESVFETEHDALSEV